MPIFCRSSSGLGRDESSGLVAFVGGDPLSSFFSPGENCPESSAELFESREVTSATDDWVARGGVFWAGVGAFNC